MPPQDEAIAELARLEAQIGQGLAAMEVTSDRLRAQWMPLVHEIEHEHPGFRRLLLSSLVLTLMKPRGRALAKIVRLFGLEDVVEGMRQEDSDDDDWQLMPMLVALLMDARHAGESE